MDTASDLDRDVLAVVDAVIDDRIYFFLYGVVRGVVVTSWGEHTQVPPRLSGRLLMRSMRATFSKPEVGLAQSRFLALDSVCRLTEWTLSPGLRSTIS
jgi:hypothetical protein